MIVAFVPLAADAGVATERGRSNGPQPRDVVSAARGIILLEPEADNIDPPPGYYRDKETGTYNPERRRVPRNNNDESDDDKLKYRMMRAVERSERFAGNGNGGGGGGAGRQLSVGGLQAVIGLISGTVGAIGAFVFMVNLVIEPARQRIQLLEVRVDKLAENDMPKEYRDTLIRRFDDNDSNQSHRIDALEKAVRDALEIAKDGLDQATRNQASIADANQHIEATDTNVRLLDRRIDVLSDQTVTRGGPR